MFRLLKASLFIGSVSVIAILHVKNFTVGDLFASILAFIPTGWALLQVSDLL
jgi:callose synthase